MDEYKDRDGKIIPKYEEPNHFPGRQLFTVTLTMPGHEGEAVPAPKEVQPPEIKQPETSPSVSPSRVAKVPVVKIAAPTQSDAWQKWLLLLLLPALWIGWFVIRRLKNK